MKKLYVDPKVGILDLLLEQQILEASNGQDLNIVNPDDTFTGNPWA